jgi:hypothetical protein
MTATTRGTAARRHRVAIVGCGFGELFAAKRLRRADVDGRSGAAAVVAGAPNASEGSSTPDASAAYVSDDTVRR